MIYFRYVIFLLLLVCSTAFSQNQIDGIDLSEGVSFEITPHSGLMGQSGILGLNLGMNYDAISLEFSGEQVIGETANLYPFSLNLIFNLSKKGKIIPYGVVGPVLFVTAPSNTIGDEVITTFGLNFGGGLRYFINNSVGVRFETKQYFTNVENKRDERDELLIFQEFSLGFIFYIK